MSDETPASVGGGHAAASLRATVDTNALKSEIRTALINRKANACPIAVRLAWHASGTYDVRDGSGGSDGATMRFAPESTDEANAGLGIVRDMLLPIKKRHPEVSFADLWVLGGHVAIEFLGGPSVPFRHGRSDARGAAACPANGRLPDAAQGAQHLRDVFHRMGFSDQEIVCLSGAHTLGRCHKVRSGFDGPWTNNPLKFDNNYFKVLLNMTWRPRKWDGPLQYEDAETGKLMMLPTDHALLTDPKFRPHVERYARSEEEFFDDFSDAFAKLTSLGCPHGVNPEARAARAAEPTHREKASAEFRTYAMHGSVERMRELRADADTEAQEETSQRRAIHKAAFWGHIGVIQYLCREVGADVHAKDYNGDTALHDACRFGHAPVVEELLRAGASPRAVNEEGLDCVQLALKQDKFDIATMLLKHLQSKL
jgi:hypothetical protein